MPIVSNKLPALPAAVRKQAAVAVKKAAYDTETLAKGYAPVDTGYLRNSIMAEQVSDLTWRVYANADYAIYVEVGSRGRSGRWYLTNALGQAGATLTSALRFAA